MAKPAAAFSSPTLNRLCQGLVVSCQPVENGPLDRPDIVALMAQAALQGGAVGVRVEGVDNFMAVKQCVDVPVIALIKRDIPETTVRITPGVADADALLRCGAQIIAYDATQRSRPEPASHLAAAIIEGGALAMADCATEADAVSALDCGAHMVGTTLSGYTAETASASDLPDLELVARCARLGGFVMAEGRYNNPGLAAQALVAGADCVTVGSAITRLEHVTRWFVDALKKYHKQAP